MPDTATTAPTPPQRWTVRLANGRYSGTFDRHSDALAHARRMRGGTPVPKGNDE